MLPKYHKHMKRYSRKSLLTRIFGMYSVTVRDVDSNSSGERYTIVVMNAVFPAEASKFVGERFDLKGSTVGRQTSEEERRKKGNNAVLKDLDLAEEVASERAVRPHSGYGLNVGASSKAALMAQLRHDVKLLVESQVMDYSLLVGIVTMDSHRMFTLFDRGETHGASHRQRQTKKRTAKADEVVLRTLAIPFRLLISPPLFCARTLVSLSQWTISSVVTSPLPYYGSGWCGVDGGALSVIYGRRRGRRAVYYLGVIDFLQPWTTRKVLERQLKGLMGYDRNAISSVTPEEYASRFLEFIDEHVS